MKRVFAIISVLSILACMMVPVSASDLGWYNDYNFPVFNVLDYATPNNRVDNSLNVNNGDTVTFDIPDNMYFNYVDILFDSQGSAPRSISIAGVQLNFINYGNGLRRAYGEITPGRYTSLDLVFSTYGTARVNFKKFDALTLNQTPVHIVGTLNYEYNGSTSDTLTMPEPRSYVTASFDRVTNPNSGTDFVDAKFRLIAPQWNLYDFLTFEVSTNFNFSAISVYGEYGAIPFTTSQYQLGSDSGDYVDKVIEITIDLRSYNKSSESAPLIEIRADQNKTNQAYFQLRDVVGNFDFQYPDPELSFLRKFMSNVGTWFTTINTSIDTFMTNVGTWFDELAASITGVFEYDTQESEDDKVALENQSSQIDDLNSKMEDVVYPDINSNDIMINEVYPNDVSYSVKPFNAVFDNQILFSIFTMSLTLALASYVLYGKR